MKDVRVVVPKVLLKVYSVSPIRSFRPPSVLVTGERLDETSEVLYNGVAAEEFVLSGPSRLVVRIPPGQVGAPLRSLEVLSGAHLYRRDARIAFEVTRPARHVEGLERLVQTWLLVFMSTPGSDVFDKASGGGAQALIGQPSNSRGVAADIALAVERTQAELIRKQAGDSRLPASEKLLSSTLESVELDVESTSVVPRVFIQNMLGESAEVSLR